MKKYAIAIALITVLACAGVRCARADGVGAVFGGGIGLVFGGPPGALIGLIIGGVFGSPADRIARGECWIDNSWHRHCPRLPVSLIR